ncbi:MAG: hypothetical protein NTY24_06050 [Mycobacterium sp.]|nr:hypothetical protein [Mycobacterium sp.]
MELVVGRIAKAHGITGEVVVDVRTDDPEAYAVLPLIMLGIKFVRLFRTHRLV